MPFTCILINYYTFLYILIQYDTNIYFVDTFLILALSGYFYFIVHCWRFLYLSGLVFDLLQLAVVGDFYISIFYEIMMNSLLKCVQIGWEYPHLNRQTVGMSNQHDFGFLISKQRSYTVIFIKKMCFLLFFVTFTHYHKVICCQSLI